MTHYNSPGFFPCKLIESTWHYIVLVSTDPGEPLRLWYLKKLFYTYILTFVLCMILCRIYFDLNQNKVSAYFWIKGIISGIVGGVISLLMYAFCFSLSRSALFSFLFIALNEFAQSEVCFLILYRVDCEIPRCFWIILWEFWYLSRNWEMFWNCSSVIQDLFFHFIFSMLSSNLIPLDSHISLYLISYCCHYHL